MRQPTEQASAPKTPAEENVYAGVYRVLLGGMLVSSVLFAIGIVLALLHPSYFPLTAKWVRAHYQASWVIHGVAHGNPLALMMVATVLLILTPVARVVASIYAFAVDRDWKYVAITSTVLLIMIATGVAGWLGLR
jgi:uncharacterized membrane protein